MGRNLKEEGVKEANLTFLAIFYVKFYDIRQALCVKSTLRSATDKNLSEKDDQAKTEQQSEAYQIWLKFKVKANTLISLVIK